MSPIDNSVIRNLAEYLEALRTFWRKILPCARKTSSDLATLIRYQEQLADRHALRFSYLVRRNVLTDSDSRSFTTLHSRIETNWGSSDETDLMNTDSAYAALVNRMHMVNLPDVPNVHLAQLQNSKEYTSARKVLTARIQQLSSAMSAAETRRENRKP